MTAPNVHLAWSRLMLQCLADAGVHHLVVSAGSRSTPLVLAAAETEGLLLHDVLDERAAGFLALGLARATGRPAAVVCTSGTAAAHYHPAVIEADLAAIPLVVLTADRPYALRARGAPQTIDQEKLFGSAVRLYLDLGLPDGSEAGLTGLRHGIARAVFAARGEVPGPVHLDAPFAKPLEPVDVPEADRADDAAVAARAAAILDAGLPWAFPARRMPAPEGVAALAAACRRAERGLIVAGPVGPWALAPGGDAGPAVAELQEAAAALARATGFPLLADATSQLRFGVEIPGRVDAAEALLRAPGFSAAHGPDLVIQLGAPPVSSTWSRYLARHPGASRWVLTRAGWPDPENTAEAVLHGDLALTARAVARALETMGLAAGPEGDPWARAWAEAGAAARAVAGALAADDPDTATAGPLTEAAVARATARAVPAGGRLVVGNSLPIRTLDAFAFEGEAIQVLHQRGANGIDGLVAGAAGVARATGRPTALLLGDQSLLHDLGGLACCADLPAALALVVVHNDGGRIFEQLPVAGRPEAAAALGPHLIMPHGRHFDAAAALFGLAHVRVEDGAALAAALAAALSSTGATILEVRVPDQGARDLFARLGPETDRALGDR